ncbi:hypothetical protein [Parendozoicomonas sp. Alg238-R29]|uniref:hypothetical protein n=1 Tax=Parendozoicomonas sp. Alg238-R29 TaxID=2993446 RepID=UPI00248F3AC6|nr:hypothetical protein [Parendozoicomonas sp. Alg238-R29]
MNMNTLGSSSYASNHFSPVTSQEQELPNPRVKALTNSTPQFSADKAGDFTTPKDKVLQKYKVTILDRVKLFVSTSVQVVASWTGLGLIVGGIASVCTLSPAPVTIGVAAGSAIGATLGVPTGIVRAALLSPEDKLTNKISKQKSSIEFMADFRLPLSRIRAEKHLREYNKLSVSREQLDTSMMGEKEPHFTPEFITSIDDKIASLSQLENQLLSNKQTVAKPIRHRLEKLNELKKSILAIQRKNEKLGEMEKSLVTMQKELNLLQS